MRISDWSSDGCSSDLVLLGVCGGFDRRDVELPERGHHRSARPLDPSRVTLCEEAVHRLGEDLPRHAKPVLEPAAGLLLAAVDQGVPVAIDLGLVLAEDLERDRLVRRERSEEHTSELQSLMRISYAVFCLKKKKKHT